MLCGNNLRIISFLILSNSAEVIRKLNSSSTNLIDTSSIVTTDVFIMADNFVIRQ